MADSKEAAGRRGDRSYHRWYADHGKSPEKKSPEPGVCIAGMPPDRSPKTLPAGTGVRGPALTVSTACSSGAAALKIALEMLRSGRAKRVLAGGADSLCRLTYYGFNALQLIDPAGARPLDADRRGMSVGEGAAMLLLTVDKPDQAVAEILGAGLSCDAYHPAAPHPGGQGALAAMQAALSDAGISSC